MKTTKYLDFYNDWSERGSMPSMGLCLCLDWNESNDMEDLFTPTEEDRITYASEIFNDTEGDVEKERRIGYYWASESRDDPNKFQFNETRQTIVLLLAAINGEL